MKLLLSSEDILFNCLNVCHLAGFDLSNIDEELLDNIFELSGTCNFKDCTAILKNGVCEENHYIPVYKLITTFLKNVNIKERDEFLNIIINKIDVFKEPKNMLDISKIYIKVLLDEKESIKMVV